MQLAQMLSPHEQEFAAQRSYAYWLTSKRSPELITPQIRLATAMREAYRHTDGVLEFDVSVRLLKETVSG